MYSKINLQKMLIEHMLVLLTTNIQSPEDSGSEVLSLCKSGRVLIRIEAAENIDEVEKPEPE